jgi:hypothetical protein
MTFDDLIFKKMPEDEIFECAAEILQENFAKYQDVFVCLELGAAEGPTRRSICYVSAVRFYKNNLNEITVYKSETDRVTHEQIPYDIVVGAFREISAAVQEERKKAS